MQTHAVQLCRYWQQQRHEITVATYRGGAPH
jgi:hypothetical protein